MNKIGNLVYWEMSEVKSTKEILESFGIDRYIPRNDYKTSLIKALHQFTKGRDEMYKRFNDSKKSVSFTVFVETVTDDDMSLNKKITIKLDKDSGILMGADGTDLIAMYDAEKKTIDSKQLRSILLKCMKRDCMGVAMRTGGGIYYINNANIPKSQEIMEAFKKVGGVSFHQVPIFDNAETHLAVEEATTSDLVGDIEGILSEIRRDCETGHLTKKRLEGKSTDIQEIMGKAHSLKEGLRTKYEELNTKLKNIEKEIDVQIKAIGEGIDRSDNFLDRLLAL